MKLATTINTVFLLASATSGCLYKREAEEPHWTYTGETGPLRWHTLSTDWGLCATGTNQSPINITPGQIDEVASINMNYPNTGNFDAENNGETIVLHPRNAQPDDYTTVLDGQNYELVQFHFHTPSEHRLSENHYPLEVHFVHSIPGSNPLQRAVVGILFDIFNDAPTDFIRTLAPASGGINNIDEEGLTTIIKNIPFQTIRKHLASHPSYTYNGSLTTPPCDEGIRWFVSSRPLRLNASQFRRFRDILHFNSRYTQNTPGQPNLLAGACPAPARRLRA